MTTYILVHGTGDEAPAEAGDDPKWWEAHSPFIADLSAKDPGATVTAFGWSGLNDEESRREAARDLFRDLKSYADDAEVVVIGHSHGGSVISLMLKLAAARGEELPQLKRWVTVGTPFIQMRRNLMPWARYSAIGLSVFIMALLALIMAGVSQWKLSTGTESAWGLAEAIGRAVGISTVVVCLIVLWIFGRKIKPFYAAKGAQRFSESFLPRWFGVSASRDEAVGALVRLPSIKPKLFSGTAFVPITRLLVISVFTMFSATSNLRFVVPFFAQLDTGLTNTPVIGPAYTAYASMLENDIIEALGSLDYEFGGLLPEIVGDYMNMGLLSVVMVLSQLLLLTALIKVGDLLTEYVWGRGIAALLNGAVQGTVIKQAYGNTTVGQTALGALAMPIPGAPNVGALTPETDHALVTYAMDHAADTLAAVHDELFGALPHEGIDPERFIAHLSWRELVHTAYFKVPAARAEIIDRAVASRV